MTFQKREPKPDGYGHNVSSAASLHSRWSTHANRLYLDLHIVSLCCLADAWRLMHHHTRVGSTHASTQSVHRAQERHQEFLEIHAVGVFVATLFLFGSGQRFEDAEEKLRSVILTVDRAVEPTFPTGNAH